MSNYPSNQPIYTVKEFNDLVNVALATQVGEVTLRGEVSSYQTRQGKWVSFDLKDGESCLNCFTALYQLDMPLADGQEVLITGKARIYVPNGRYSFQVRSVQLMGEGALQKAFEQLKQKLTAEGLFDSRYKKPLPRFPRKIGIVTSKESAAINDIQKVLNGRMGGLELYLMPVLVQGKDAPDELVGALSYFNAYHPVDVIIFGRGGGSLEDLQAFNSEKVARAIFASKIPIICGIGHEHNTSIADLVADVRAATPSNAAELCVQDNVALRRHIFHLTTIMEASVMRAIALRRHAVTSYLRLLPQLVQRQMGEIRSVLAQFSRCLETSQQSIIYQRSHLTHRRDQLMGYTTQVLATQKETIHKHRAVLQALNPLQVLQRGYTITYDHQSGKPITTLAEAPKAGELRTQFHDGTLVSRVGQLAKIKLTPQLAPDQSQLFDTTVVASEETIA